MHPCPLFAPAAPSRRTLLGLAAGSLVACALPAWSRTVTDGRWLQLEVQDRDSGQTLPLYAADGNWYVAGRPGARYGVLLRNLRRERVLLVMSVDGVNVLTGQSAGWNQDGYVLGPLERAQIAGWRKSDREIAAFEFTAQSESYAARTGRPLDVGVIGVAVFRERRPEPRPLPRPLPPVSDWRDRSANKSAEGQAPLPVPPGAQPAPAEAESYQRKQESPAADAANSSMARRERATAEQKLGTGHGERETSVVGRTTFERASSTPDEIVALRYDSRANLIAQGIIPAREPGRSAPQPFPRSPQPGFVPDPPRY